MTRDNKSYLEHNGHYINETIEEVRTLHLANTNNKVHYKPYDSLGNLLDKYGITLQFGVDIGSGTGWASDLLSSYFQQVFSIEPSAAAQSTAQTLYGHRNNITWINAFAEDALSKISLEGPALFYSACVLSHLQDETVIKICAALNTIAPEGSILSFAENYGVVHNEYCWHSRTKEWWLSQLPGWALSYLNYPGTHPGMYKSFSGIKTQKAAHSAPSSCSTRVIS